MPAPPQFAFPFGRDGYGNIATVPQHSDAEIAGCIQAILCYPLGSRPVYPDFGVAEEAFLQSGPNLDEIRQAVLDNEPRAEVEVFLDDASLTNAIAQVRLAFDTTADASL